MLKKGILKNEFKGSQLLIMMNDYKLTIQMKLHIDGIKMNQKIIDNKEIILFLIILLVIAFLIIIFRLDIILGIQNTITLFAVLVALGASILSLLYNNKILRQSERNLNTQLLHEDKKKALLDLLEKLNTNNNIFDITYFLESTDSLYLPNNTRNFIILVLKELSEELGSPGVHSTYDYQRIMGIYRKKLKDHIVDNLMNPINTKSS